ncbi:MAG: HlyD family efflux transporter periplasmic adaptor subunit [Pseudomonadota bacterium]
MADASAPVEVEETTAPARPKQIGLWRSLSDAPDLPTRAESWAALMLEQLQDMPGVEPIAVTSFLYDSPYKRLTPLGFSPVNRATTALAAGTTQSAAEKQRPVAQGELPQGDRAASGPMAAAVPIVVGELCVGVVCAEMHPDGEREMRKAMRRLQWGAAWVRDQLRSVVFEDEQQRHQAAIEALNAVVSVAERKDFHTAASSAVTDLATRFDCTRVALGMRRFKRTKVRAISHSAQFSRRMSQIQNIKTAMDEAIDQRTAVLWPEIDEHEVYASANAKALAEEDGAGHVYTVPLYAIDSFVGALTFERPEDKPFSEKDLDILEAVSTVLAPILEEKRRNDRWLITKTFEVIGNQLRRLLGPSYLIRKLVAAAVIAAGVFFWFAQAPFQVSAEARVIGTVERSIVAGFDGFIAEAPVAAGSLVSKDDLLVLLDDRDLALERQRLLTQRQRQQIEFDRAVAARDRAEINIRQTLIAQADAEISLVDQELERTRLTAPFDGLILSGDLSQSIGSSVSRGEQLLVIAPADAYRVKLQVDERQIAEVETGQVGALRVTALPTETFPILIEKITPVATYAEGATTFEVEAVFLEDATALRPGMEGAARIDIEERRLISIWTQPLIDWARISLWRWLPV